MNKIEYGDLYKFLASLGVGFFVLAVLVPWLFLKEPFHLLVGADRIKEIPAEAMDILNTRTAIVAYITSKLLWITLACLFLGVVFLFCGLYFWWPKQQTQDALDNIKKIKKELELRAMDVEEVQRKSESEGKAEAAEEVDAFVDAEFGTTVTDKRPAEKVGPSPLLFAQQYRELEERVVKKLYDCLGPAYRIRPNMRLGATEYDCILESKVDQLPDVVVEIKYLAAKVIAGRLIRSARQLASSSQTYRLVTERGVIPFLLFITRRTMSSEDWDKYRTKSLEEASRLGADLMKIGCISDEELDDLPCRKLWDMIGIS